MHRKKITLIAALAAFVGGAAFAQEYPERPITIVVPYGAGGTSDGQVRMFQEALGKALGQTIVVENKPGASGALGALQVARAKADGYTLLFPNNGVLTAPLLNAKAGYDPFKDFKPISLVSAVPMVLVVNKEVPSSDVKSFIEYLRKQSEGVMYASAGPASYGHLSTVRMAQLMGVKLEHIPYKGEAATTMAVRSGEVKMLLTTPSSSMLGQVQQGNLTLLGVATAEPSPVVPGVPTLNKTIPGFTAEAWFGLLAPAGTPDSVVNKINAALKKVMADDALKAKLLASGAVVRTSTPAEFGQLMRKESGQLQDVITQFNIKTD